MAPSKCDQKKAEIIRHVEKECSAITDRAKAEYELKCLKVKDEYKAKRQQANHSLNQQEMKELNEIKRLHEAEMEPIKVSNAQKLSEARELYQIAAPEAGLRPSASSETHSSPTLVTTPAEISNKNSAASKRSLDDAQESGDETDTSIPAFDPEATEEAERTPPLKKRKLRARTFRRDYEDSHSIQSDSRDEDYEEDEDHEEDEESEDRAEEDEESEGRAEEDDTSDDSSRDLRQVFETFDGASAQRAGRNNVPSASPTTTKNRSRWNEVIKNLETRGTASSSSRKTNDQVEGGDEDEAIHSGSPSQAPPRHSVRSGRHEPGKYRITAKAWPALGR